MSYSFTVHGATKAEAKQKVGAEFDKVLSTQPIHSHDRDQAQAAANAFVDILPDDDSKAIYVSVHGSVSWSGYAGKAEISAAGVGVSASLVAKT